MGYLAGAGAAECGARTPSAHVNPTATPGRLPRRRLLAQASGVAHATPFTAGNRPRTGGAGQQGRTGVLLAGVGQLTILWRRTQGRSRTDHDR
jgi:hypothetical protein